VIVDVQCSAAKSSIQSIINTKGFPMPEHKASQICIVTVTGEDRVGIIAKLATTMAKANINIVDVNQKIMEDLRDDDGGRYRPGHPRHGPDQEAARQVGRQMALKITIQDESIFKAMHRV
jgi:ACT domain-containing protein